MPELSEYSQATSWPEDVEMACSVEENERGDEEGPTHNDLEAYDQRVFDQNKQNKRARSSNTQKLYLPLQREFTKHCKERRYRDADLVYEYKLLYFLREHVVKRPLQCHSNTPEAGTPLADRRPKHSSLIAYVNAITDLWQSQRKNGKNSNAHPRGTIVREFLRSYKREESIRCGKDASADKSRNTADMLPGNCTLARVNGRSRIRLSDTSATELEDQVVSDVVECLTMLSSQIADVTSIVTSKLDLMTPKLDLMTEETRQMKEETRQLNMALHAENERRMASELRYNQLFALYTMHLRPPSMPTPHAQPPVQSPAAYAVASQAAHAHLAVQSPTASAVASQAAAAPTPHAHAPAPPMTGFPAHTMRRDTSTVLGLWEEWTVGVFGEPSIKQLDAQYGAKWRQTPGEREWYSKRNEVIREVAHRCECGQSEEEALQSLKEEHERSGRSFSVFCTALRRARQAREKP